MLKKKYARQGQMIFLIALMKENNQMLTCLLKVKILQLKCNTFVVWMRFISKYSFVLLSICGLEFNYCMTQFFHKSFKDFISFLRFLVFFQKIRFQVI